MFSVATLKSSPLGLAACVLALLAMTMMPASAVAKVYLSGPGSSEGDPVDSNDLGDDGSASGGGADDDINDALSVYPPADPEMPRGLELLRFVVVPTTTGLISFRFIMIFDWMQVAPEGAYAR